MSKIRVIDTGKCKVLALLLDSYFVYPAGIVGSEFYYWTTVSAQNMGDYPMSEHLPDGEWEYLGFSTELNEEQWKEIIESAGWPYIGLYKNYSTDESGKLNHKPYPTASQSGLSLLEANQCYSKNPYGEYIQDLADGKYKDTKEKHDKFQQAQENTGSWLLLKQLD